MYWKQLMQLLVVLHMQDIKKTRTISAFHKKVERTKTTTTSVRLHIESFIEAVPIVFYTFQWKTTRSFLNIQ